MDDKAKRICEEMERLVAEPVNLNECGSDTLSIMSILHAILGAAYCGSLGRLDDHVSAFVRDDLERFKSATRNN